MKVSTEIDNNFGYEKITQLVDNIPLENDNRTKHCHNLEFVHISFVLFTIFVSLRS